jgi:hypothetical protein
LRLHDQNKKLILKQRHEYEWENLFELKIAQKVQKRNLPNQFFQLKKDNHKISLATFYIWQRRLSISIRIILEKNREQV